MAAVDRVVRLLVEYSHLRRVSLTNLPYRNYTIRGAGGVNSISVLCNDFVANSGILPEIFGDLRTKVLLYSTLQ